MHFLVQVGERKLAADGFQLRDLLRPSGLPQQPGSIRLARVEIHVEAVLRDGKYSCNDSTARRNSERRAVQTDEVHGEADRGIAGVTEIQRRVPPSTEGELGQREGSGLQPST